MNVSTREHPVAGQPPDWIPAAQRFHVLTERDTDEAGIEAFVANQAMAAADECPRCEEMDNALREARVAGFTAGVVFAVVLPLLGYGLALGIGALMIHFGGSAP
jgi:tetrahydromethanopterin S-methyltransferase subunit F